MPTAFLNFHAQFLQTHLKDSLAYCFGALSMLKLTRAEISAGRIFFAGEFLAKKNENSDFLRGQVLLGRTSLS